MARPRRTALAVAAQARRPVQTVPRPAFIAFPVSARTRWLLEQAGVEDRAGKNLFEGKAAVLTNAFQTAIRAAGVRASAAVATRWLFHRLATMKNGDIALAALVTGHVPVTAATVVQYTMIDAADVPAWLATALTGFDTLTEGADRIHPVALGSRNARVSPTSGHSSRG